MDAQLLLADLEPRYGNMEINWEAILAAQYRSALMNPRTVVDVVAHQAAHTAHLLDLGARRVVAFEPNPQLAVALCRAPGCATLMINRSRPGETGLRSRSLQDEEAITVAVTTLGRIRSGRHP